MKLFIKVAVGIFLLLVLAAGGFFIFMTSGLKSGEVLTVNGLKASELTDGVFTGEYDGGRWTNEVMVTIENSKLVKVDVVKSVMFERPELTEELFKKVIEKQDTDVDAVSGATVTSRAYLKSIENAVVK